MMFDETPKTPLKLTEDEIEAGRTPKGGFTRATLASWGVSWPPPKGWREALLNGEPVPLPGDIAARSTLVGESVPNSIEAQLLREVVMAVIDAGHGEILAGVENYNAYKGVRLPTVEDVVGGRPETAIIDGGITWDDKVYRFSVARNL